MRVGFIGLGNIGGRCARHVLAAGHELTVADLDDSACRRLVEAGATAAVDPAGVAEVSDVVLLSLPSPEASRAVVSASAGVLSGAVPGLVVVDLSTNSVDVTKELFGVCAAAGVDFVDCPVSGGHPGADAGELTLMPSGDEAAFDRCREVLLCFGKAETEWLGPSGTGTLLKLINNLVFLVGTQVFEEAYLMAAKAGLDIPKFLEVLRASSAGFYMALASMIVNRQWDNSTYDLALAEKDLRLALDSAAHIDTPLPLTEAAHRVLSTSVEMGLGEKFFIGALEALEEQAGFTAPVPEEG
ncbi:MAG: NAD(P)-dependent oxidoreductase [Acidimicrobiaceae bacterium]|nr:NAD(P)-dependent oxidoreductase [Acidimicrobiaceae bacterium]MXW77252.1 NAD(P)-dependent oxidoreductase [Acidimicrobiaceae bacterium]MYA73115.1 NAD(P)-dependent oxidoreductase [Acidimicrobiaceae bacterium]MYC42130.1 NAD(P)-dependent oxidoreductase [Acidimicrobiaceae bacterium]MYD06797.1 NAD(P)-dependent oxidoreductase [Acidimicrobiaceae bacterium]